MAELKYYRKNRIFEENLVSSSVLQIKIDKIRPNRAQPRAEFDNNSIIRLADSIRRYGILQPLCVRLSEDDKSYEYELIAGERRLRAARMLGYYSVPCVIIEADERMSAEMAIIENLLRDDLNMFEQAYGFKQLIDNYGLTQEEVARKMSLSQSAVANKLRLLRLSYDEQKQIIASGLSERHARALLKVENKQERLEIIRHIAEQRLNVVTAEQYIDNLLCKVAEKLPDGQMNEKAQPPREKTLGDMLGRLQEVVSSIKKLGNEAEIDVSDEENKLDIHITVAK